MLTELVRDLKREVSSATADAIPRALLIDLNTLACSTKLEVVPSDPDNDLRRDVCSAKVVVELTVPVRVFMSPFVSEPTIAIEPLRDLNREFCSVTLALGLNEARNVRTRPLTSDPETLTELA